MNRSNPSVRFCVLLASILITGGGCATVGKPVRGVDNFAVVDSGPGALYRGGQPSRTGVKTLKEMGVRTVIDLRADAVSWERSAVEAAGMTYVNIPTVAWDVDPDRVEQVLETVRTCKRPAFIHCRHGRDRTGLSVAVYRMVEQPDAWTRQAAISDLRQHGYHSLLFPGIQRYLASFEPSKLAAVPAVAAVPQAAIVAPAAAAAAQVVVDAAQGDLPTTRPATH